jgi:Ca-activated chloride channel family protein
MQRSRILQTLFALSAVVLSVAALPSDASAIGLLIPDQNGVRPFDIQSHRVDVTITNNAAVTEVEQVFKNHTNRPMEATFVFPLPKGATVSDFSLWINGKKTQGSVLEKEEARRIYESIVRRVKDPGLVEYMDGRLFRASIFPIPPGGTQKLELKFSQVLERRGGLYRYTYPMNAGEKYVKAKTDKDFTLSAHIKSPVPITTVYSPTHRIGTTRDSDHEVTVGTEKMKETLDRDFQLYLGHSKRDIGLNMMTYDPDGEGGEEGYFMAALAPRVDLEEDEQLPQSFTFVVDTSGSMNGEKIEQARETLEFCIGRLDAKDRFNVVRFSTGVETLFEEPQQATESARKQGLSFARNLRAAGGTAISKALDRALDQTIADEHVHQVIFVTDGIPTIGMTEPDAILKRVARKLGSNGRIFSFGLGYDVNTKLTDGLANEGRGHSDYVKPDEHLEDAVSALYTRISSPVLSDVEVDFGGARVFDAYPNPLPDIFKGDQIVVFGRHRQAFGDQVVVKGRAGGQARVFEYNVGGQTEQEVSKKSAEAASIATDDLAFIPELWATRKVGYLLDQIRLNGEQPELKKEVVRLAKKFGLVTPYTSYLAVDDSELQQRRRRRPPRDPLPRPVPEPRIHGGGGPTGSDGSSLSQSRGSTARAPREKAEAEDSVDVKMFDAFGKSTGSGAVKAAEETKKMKDKGRVDSDRGRSTKYVAGRTFQRTDGEWRQEGVDAEGATEVEAYSKQYFTLLRKHADFKQIASLGDRIVVRLDGTVYRIVAAEE